MSIESTLLDIEHALQKDLETGMAYHELQTKYLKKNGLIRDLYQQMGQLDPDSRQALGQKLNTLKDQIESYGKQAQQVSGKKSGQAIDVSRQPSMIEHGALHPITLTLNEVMDIFEGFGFDIVDDNELETTEYCFDRLRIPKWHPARDTQDTFYIKDEEELILRTQTTATQLKILEKTEPPINVISLGKVYRSDEIDATHTPVFHQIDGFMVDEAISLPHLKGTLEMFVRAFIPGIKNIRFRPHYFSYTEPSLELDVQCVLCGGSGCKACKHAGWIEVLGAGMMHPNLFVDAGYPRDKYTGFAFGFGVERIVMQRHGIEDIRLLFANEIEMIGQIGQ